jgi:Ran GTPase-activating protein (RanGAP) involved in mRNA processing and transport
MLRRLKANYLLELYLSYNYIGHSSIAKLTEVLQAHNTPHPQTRRKLTDASLVIFSGGLSNCDLLQELALARNFIGNLGAAVLSTFVKNASALQKLNLHWNQIRRGSKETGETISRV